MATKERPIGSARYFWFPFLIDEIARDTTRLNDHQYRLYINLLVALWRLGFDLSEADAPQAIACKKSELLDLIAKVPGLDIEAGKIVAPRFAEEYARAVKIREGARRAAAVRWQGGGNE